MAFHVRGTNFVPCPKGNLQLEYCFSESFGQATNMNKVGPFKSHDFFLVFWDLDNKFTTFLLYLTQQQLWFLFIYTFSWPIKQWKNGI